MTDTEPTSTEPMAATTGTEPPVPELPVDTLRDAAPHLRRPFDIHAVQFRALEGSRGETLNCAAYITARTVIDRLNLVCPHLWDEARYELIPGGLRCDLTIDGKTRSDVGWATTPKSWNDPQAAMNLKALYSDAFKRAAVKCGVGVSLYALPRLVLRVDAGQAWAKAIPNQKDNYGNPKFRYGITDKGARELRARYERWLGGPGKAGFGPVLPHGHVEGSADPEDEGTPEPEDAAEVMAADVDRKALKDAARGLLWRQVRVAYSAAGISAPEKADRKFETVPAGKVAGLVKELAAAPRNPPS